VILVVGGTGQVGFALVRRLRERGEDVTVLARPHTDAGTVSAIGGRVVRGDLREAGSLRSICEGVHTVVATANAIVPRRGEGADFGAIADGYAELGRIARAAGVQRFLFVSVPRELIGRGALEFDAKARAEAALASEGPSLTIVRSSLYMEAWLPHLGSRLPLRGSEHPTLDRGFWLTRFAGATAQRTLDRFGIALLLGDGTARHAFIAVGDVADALAAATSDAALEDEVHLGGPEVLSWAEVADVYARVLSRRIHTVRQPTRPLRALSAAVRTRNPALSHLLAAEALVATVDLAYPPDDASRLLGRNPISVETFLRQRLALA
jgi:uncharacterized protein YbjT (DUF2867 family)